MPLLEGLYHAVKKLGPISLSWDSLGSVSYTGDATSVRDKSNIDT